MRTPAGKECRYFYGDYYRGRHREECRLLEAASPSLNWSSDLCISCPVPEIQQANACRSMELRASVYRPFPFIRRQVKVSAYCTKCQCNVTEPHIGCGECHTLPSIFTGASSDPDTAD